MDSAQLVIFTILCLVWGALFAEESDLMRDLLVVDSINRSMNDTFPVTYNHLLQGGYLNMPSSRIGEAGELGIGYSYVSPYRNYNFRAQLFSNLELTANYRIFSGVEDPVLSKFGFGEFADKGMNLKWAVVHPEDSDYQLPGLAIGVDDLIGTRQFRAGYAVLTQVLPRFNIEGSLGYGWKRYHGFFGGVLWMPWRGGHIPYLHNFGLTAEYDATDYKYRDPHPEGKTVFSRLNYGLKYRLWDYFDFSLSYIKGFKWAGAMSASYNFGKTKGFLPKIEDPLPYTCPSNHAPIGVVRTEEVLIQDLLHAFYDQGFTLLKGWISYSTCGERTLRLSVYNHTWSFDQRIRARLNNLLAHLIPRNIDRVIIVMESEGFPIQEYHFRAPFLEDYEGKKMGDYELDLLTPMHDVTNPNPCSTQLVFQQERRYFIPTLLPKIQTFFGSSSGKFKYALGVNAGFSGIYNDIYYQVLFGYLGASQLRDFIGVDMLNPSQLINVRTDIVRYYRYQGITIDAAYLQRVFNLGSGFYSRGSFGYYTQPYAGAALEFLYYPANSHFAVGLEASILRKRKTHGLSLSPRIRRFNGFIPHYVRFTGTQFFLDLYYDNPSLEMDMKMSVGQFLAKDTGVRWEVGRYFSNGFRVMMWYTMTNAHDKVNGSTYYDKGIGFSMPLDIFYPYSTRDKWRYSIAAWLRDCGYRASTGKGLYELIHDQRIK